MRRLVVLLLLVGLLVAAIWLNRLLANWHYVVPVTAGETAYLATFDADDGDWNLAEGRLSASILDTGVLRLEITEPLKLPFAEAKPHFADFDLRVQAAAADGPLNNGYGVIFRLQNKDNVSPGDDDYYLFMVSSDGYYQLSRSINGVAKEVSTWIPSQAVNQGLGVSNWLRVVARGDQFQFFVNNQQVALCIPDDPSAQSTYNSVSGECVGGQMVETLTDASIPSGQIGVAAQSFDQGGVVIDFDNLVILGPA
ncbi:MAG: hypothetical protein JNJ61_03850 [Anaerolineae bacterium]|nr:hypothetical protein [Anaerolineae bacterium]